MCLWQLKTTDKCGLTWKQWSKPHCIHKRSGVHLADPETKAQKTHMMERPLGSTRFSGPHTCRLGRNMWLGVGRGGPRDFCSSSPLFPHGSTLYHSVYILFLNLFLASAEAQAPAAHTARRALYHRPPSSVLHIYFSKEKFLLLKRTKSLQNVENLLRKPPKGDRYNARNLVSF